MTIDRKHQDRHNIPRWRSVSRTADAGEFQRLRNARVLDATHSQELDDLQQRWDKTRTDGSARELVDAAIVAGEHHLAIEAADHLVKDSGDDPDAVALSLLKVESKIPSTAPTFERSILSEEFHRKVHEARERTRRDPRNAIGWSDLARRYTVLGQFDLAERALRIARLLAPQSRYLLRAEARFLMHVGRPERALAQLERSPRTPSDPWLLAASISVAASIGASPKNVKSARRVIEAKMFLPIELSELQSELGTLELSAGSTKKAKNLMALSNQAPTDNSLAQLEWVSHHLPSLYVETNRADIPFRAEAQMLDASQRGRWSEAIQHAILWIDDQPFDTQAAAFGSYIAAAGLDDWTTSRTFAEIGLLANPNDLTLINNLAYSLIELGELPTAATLLLRTPADSSDPGTAAALDATRGLLRFRQGDADAGLRYYESAIERTRKGPRKNPEQEAMARSMLLTEQLKFGNKHEMAAKVNIIDKLRSRTTDPAIKRIIARTLDLARVEAQTPN
jgi:tetratricopeptide (TPR) repeat protein